MDDCSVGTAARSRGGKCSLHPPPGAEPWEGWGSRRQVRARHILGACFVATSPAHPSCFMLLVGALLRLAGNVITNTVGGLQVQSWQ